mmetsp:Transcript_61767/g.199125  ORF Transcript_61767/g.199125 Transcript_61767/m.199125 type:complete len:260 (+) Transcript_61767:75-854(+)
MSLPLLHMLMFGAFALNSHCAALRMQGTSRNASKLQFIHVGKAGGSSIRSWLRQNNISFDETHLEPVHTCRGDEHRKWMIAVREPIARIVSSFNWRSPRNGMFRNAYTWSELEFYNCFSTVNDFAEALNNTTRCGDLARGALRDPEHSQHIGMGVAWYLQNDLDCILMQEFHLVHTETFVDDLQKAAAWLNVDNPDMDIPYEKSQYPMRNQTFVSLKGRRLLSQSLVAEYDVMAMLESSAYNRKSAGEKPSMRREVSRI